MDFYRIAASKPSNALHLVQTHEEEEYVNFHGQMIKASQFHNQNTQEQTLILNPATTVPSTIFQNSNGFVDSYLENDGKIHHLKRIFIEMDVTNNDSNVWSGNPAEFWIQRVDTYIGDKLVGSDYDIGKYVSGYSFVSNEEMTVKGPRQNISATTYATYGTLAAGATQRYQIDITGVLRNTNIFVAGLPNRLRQTIYFQGIANFGISANPVISVANVNILVRHTLLNKENFDKELTVYKNLGLRLRFTDQRYFKYAVTNVAATSQTQRINSITGLSSILWVFCRPSNPTGTGMVTFRSLDNLALTDGNVNLVGGQPLRGLQMLAECSDYFPSTIYSVQNVYPFIFASNPVHSWQNNVNTGYMYLADTYQVQWTPAASNADQLELISMNFNSLFIQGQTVVVERTQ